MVLVVRDNQRFWEILVENDPFGEFIIGKVTVGRSSIIILIVYNPPERANEPNQIFNEDTKRKKLGLWKRQQNKPVLDKEMY